MNGTAISSGEQNDAAIPRLNQRSTTDASNLVDGESECWSQRNLLSLDGGGIRGYWTLLVLQRLMEAIGYEERALTESDDAHSFHPQQLPPNVTQHPSEPNSGRGAPRIDNDDSRRFLPCHYFDLMCGSSTGSLIAIMLCRFRMTVADCLREYEKMSQQIFGNPRFISQRNIGFVRWPKYRASYLEDAFKDVTRRRGESPSANQGADFEPNFPTQRYSCGMFVTTKRDRKPGTVGFDEKIHLIRSYNNRQQKASRVVGQPVNYGDAEKMLIWQVARAATAAPLYFTEFKYRKGSGDQKEKIRFSDGGFGHSNNPTLLGYQELTSLFGKTGVGVIVSIGTARAAGSPRAGRKGILHRVKEAFEDATDPNVVANVMMSYELEHYYRLNDEQGLNIELDEWKPKGPWRKSNSRGQTTLGHIRDKFYEWIANRENDRKIQECAAELVQRRLQRTQQVDRWRRYANAASSYRCQSEDHEDCSKGFMSRDAFDEHWRSKHQGSANATRFQEPEYTEWTYPRR